MHIHTYVRKVDVDKRTFEVVVRDYRSRNLNGVKPVVEEYINASSSIVVSSYVGIVGPFRYVIGCNLMNRQIFGGKKKRSIKKELVKRLNGIELVLLMTP